MLYKKIHRQYLKEWRVGRKFKCKSRFGVFEITGKPYIFGRHIRVDEVNKYEEETYDLILALDNGRRWNMNIVTWLD